MSQFDIDLENNLLRPLDAEELYFRQVQEEDEARKKKKKKGKKGGDEQ